MRSLDSTPAHASALLNTEQSLASAFGVQSNYSEGKPNFHNIYAELSSLRQADNKLYGANADAQFGRDLGDINQYLKSKNLPALDIDTKELAPKLEEDLKAATKSKDFSNVYGRLDALKEADERKYGKELGDLLFNQADQGHQ